MRYDPGVVRVNQRSLLPRHVLHLTALNLVKIVWVLETKRIRNAVKKGEERADIHRLGDLRIGPATLAELLCVVRCQSVRRLGEFLDVPQELVLLLPEARGLQVALRQRFVDLPIRSLQLQEERMRTRSVRTAIQPRDIGRNHLFHPSGEMPFFKMKGIDELDELLEHVGTLTEALQNARYIAAIVTGFPTPVDLRELTFRVSVLKPLNMWHVKSTFAVGFGKLKPE